ncbi:hypothetical protein EVAR_434_1 [Eumeta japonica]|uniref:Uncharacterized protein n=1 Tax=Eumeta variegata TaxID=151549 RepID=A0A4C1SA71_EUMVA|nr:hypothetical protein EVAR_434_1 [Eumeta japonica]
MDTHKPRGITIATLFGRNVIFDGGKEQWDSGTITQRTKRTAEAVTSVGVWYLTVRTSSFSYCKRFDNSLAQSCAYFCGLFEQKQQLEAIKSNPREIKEKVIIVFSGNNEQLKAGRDRAPDPNSIWRLPARDSITITL